MNIYVSPELRDKMKEYDAVINWSKVAASAFEAAIITHVEMVKLKKKRMHAMNIAYSWVSGVKKIKPHAIDTEEVDPFIAELNKGY